MNDLHRLAEAAVRRDLQRARVLLADRTPLSLERHRLIGEHIEWMCGLVEPVDRSVTESLVRLVRAAREFGSNREREHREQLVLAIDLMLAATDLIEGWTSASAIRRLGPWVPWLLDGVAVPAAGGRRVHPSVRELGRLEAASYRRGRFRLWGSVSAEVPAQRAGDQRRPIATP